MSTSARERSTRNVSILALARAGVAYSEIASMYGITPARVSQIAGEAGIRRSPDKRPWASLSETGRALAQANVCRAQAARFMALADAFDAMARGKA